MKRKTRQKGYDEAQIVPSLIQGRIVYPKDPVPDPQGNNPKLDRPFVVISTRNEIENGDDLRLVGVTTEHTISNPDDYIQLPGQNSRSFLQDGSAALRTWQITLPQSGVEIGRGYLQPKKVWEIISKVDELDDAAEP